MNLPFMFTSLGKISGKRKSLLACQSTLILQQLRTCTEKLPSSQDKYDCHCQSPPPPAYINVMQGISQYQGQNIHQFMRLHHYHHP